MASLFYCTGLPAFSGQYMSVQYSLCTDTTYVNYLFKNTVRMPRTAIILYFYRYLHTLYMYRVLPKDDSSKKVDAGIKKLL